MAPKRADGIIWVEDYEAGLAYRRELGLTNWDILTPATLARGRGKARPSLGNILIVGLCPMTDEQKAAIYPLFAEYVRKELLA